jgi:hypothetical protein
MALSLEIMQQLPPQEASANRSSVPLKYHSGRLAIDTSESWLAFHLITFDLQSNGKQCTF